MKLKTKRISVLLLVIALVISTPNLFGFKTAEASNANLVYAPNYHVDGLDLTGEEGNTTAVCQYINNLFINYGWNYGWEGIWTDWSAVEWRYLNNALNAELYYDKVALFTKGHSSYMVCYQGGPHHHFLMTNQYNVNDRNYGWYTYNLKHAFAFIWHCGTAEDYVPGTSMICTSCGGYSSFPMAIFRDNTLSLDGYNSQTGSRVFLGFQGYSPQFLANNGLLPNFQYFHFCSLIYMNLVQNHYTTRNSLREASYTAFGTYDFPSTWVGQFKDDWDPDGGGPLVPYDSQMKVFGNGGLGIPEY